MAMGKTCCFTGHRPQRLGFGEDSPQCDRLKEKIRMIIVVLIERLGYTHFITGMALGVDLYAAQIVLDLKAKYPQITLEGVLPCENQAAYWSPRDREIHRRIYAACDRKTLLQKGYTKDCMQRRNRYMVDHAECVLAVWSGAPSGTCNTVRYAQSKNVPVLLLDPVGLGLTTLGTLITPAN